MKVRALLYLFHLVLLLSATTAHASLSSRGDTPGGFHQCAETFVASGNVDWRNTSANAGFSDSNDHALVSKRQAMRRDSPSRADNAPTPHLLSIRDISVRFTQLPAIASSGLALVIGSLVAGCGGGNGSADVASQASSTSSSTSASTTAGAPAAAGDSAILQSGSTSGGSAEPVASGDGNPDAGNAAAASADSTATPAAAHVSDTVALSSHSGLGTNLAQVSYYSAQYPTIDFMKRAGAWLTQCSTYTNKDCKTSVWDSGEEASLDLDANGWVKSLPANGAAATYRYVTTVLLSGGTQPVGKYVVRYDGQGTITYGGLGTKVAAESSAGRDVVNVVAGNSTLMLSITATNPANYVRNIRVYAPGGACSADMNTWVTSAAGCTSGKGTYVAFENFPAGSTWFPTFMAGVKGYRTLRFMDWQQTNLTKVTAWADRTQPTARIWSANAGVPVEAMFDLAKNAGADPWMNIPPYATDDYIHQFGKLAHANLAAGQTLNLEYGNEMWNYSFAATTWAVAQAKTALASAAAKGVDQNSLLRNWYAQRLVQACNIVKGEFGADASRVRCIANTQAANAWDTSQVLSCPYAGGACAKSIDVVAIAPYFGQYISNAANRPTVAGWYADTDGGLTKMFAEIVGTDIAATASAITPLASTAKVPGGSLAQIKTWMVATKAAADKYGVPMWAYEGGQSLLPLANDTDQSLLNLMIAANRDARMGAAYQTMLSDWKAAGGQTFAIFTDIATPSKYGFWGLRESQWDTAANAPKWKTALQWRDNTACWWTGC